MEAYENSGTRGLCLWYRITYTYMWIARRRIWIAGGSIAVLAGILLCGAYMHHQHISALTEPGATAHSIKLTQDGFYPAQITVRKGDTVTFSTDLDKPFWPASSFHPSHALYAGFDPQKPILPTAQWSFEFNEEGQWGYHDHLDPQKVGEVNVLSGWDLFPEKDVPCEELSGSEKMRCFDQTLKSHLTEEGIDAAFEYFKKIYGTHPEVAVECHDWTHKLGELEYKLYAKGGDVALREEASFCSYGYYHGFINAMVAQTHSIQSAQQFCAQAAEEGGRASLGIKESCVHGIGHSAATLILENQDVWGDVRTVIQKASSECEKLYADSPGTCLDGMFHELYGSIGRGDYGLSADEYIQSGDLFFYCHAVDGLLAESCFAEFIKLWPYFLGEDKKETMKYVLANASDILVKSPRVLHSLARSFIEMEIEEGDFQESADACALVPTALLEDCIRGLAIGFVTHGNPGSQHDAGFAFCRNHYEEKMRSLCIEKMVAELSSKYTQDQLHTACLQLPKDEQPPCLPLASPVEQGRE